MDKPRPVYDWDSIERACIAGLPFKEVARRFEVPHGTLIKRASRHKWPTPTRVRQRANELAVKSANVAQTVAETWMERGEDHRKTVFELAHKSIKRMKPRTPKNWKEADIADKMARRAAGLENAEVVQQTLIQINETDEQPIEATSSEISQEDQSLPS